MNKILYFYAEFDSVSYSKAIEYDFNDLKAILSVKQKLGLLKFVQKFSMSFIKAALFIILYPLLGKDFFLNRRGLNASTEQIKEFDKIYTTFKDQITV